MTTATQTQVPAGTWAIDTTHSSAGFEIAYNLATFRGRFHEFAARLEDGVLTGSVQPASVDVSDENLAAHLRTPEFFDVETHPEIAFASRSIDVDEDGNLRLEGDFTIKGITKPVTATGRFAHFEQDAFGSPRVTFTLEALIDRTEFDLAWNIRLPGGGFALADDVRLLVDLQLVPESR